MTDDRLRDAAAAVFGYLDELAGDPRLAARVGLLRAWVEANLPGAEPSNDLRARVIAVLTDAGVYVAPGEATWERFMDALNAPMSTRSIIAVSAAALWLKAGEREKVDAIADLCLSLPDRFTPAACAELRDIKTKAQALP